MTMITQHTDSKTLDESGRQIKSTVTFDEARYDAWMEIIEGCGPVEGAELSGRALTLCDDHGIDDLDDFSMGNYLDGGILDWRVVLNSEGEAMEYQLLVGFGGPNVWHDIDMLGSLTIRVSWWGTQGRGEGRHDFFALMFDYMDELRQCR